MVVVPRLEQELLLLLGERRCSLEVLVHRDHVARRMMLLLLTSNEALVVRCMIAVVINNNIIITIDTSTIDTDGVACSNQMRRCEWRRCLAVQLLAPLRTKQLELVGIGHQRLGIIVHSAVVDRRQSRHTVGLVVIEQRSSDRGVRLVEYLVVVELANRERGRAEIAAAAVAAPHARGPRGRRDLTRALARGVFAATGRSISHVCVCARVVEGDQGNDEEQHKIACVIDRSIRSMGSR